MLSQPVKTLRSLARLIIPDASTRAPFNDKHPAGIGEQHPVNHHDQIDQQIKLAGPGFRQKAHQHGEAYVAILYIGPGHPEHDAVYGDEYRQFLSPLKRFADGVATD